MITNSQLSTTEPKNKNKYKLREWGDRGQGIRSVIRRLKIDRRRLRIVWEMGKTQNLYIQPMDKVGELWRDGWCRVKGHKGEKNGSIVIA